jgi:hypothetical protein
MATEEPKAGVLNGDALLRGALLEIERHVGFV